MNTAREQVDNQVDSFIVNHDFFVNAKKELQRCMDSCNKTREPRCIPIYGPSGCGKSTMIETFADDYPAIKHDMSWERPVVVVEVPSNPTPRTMASEVLKQQGDPLYHQGTEVQMTARIVAFAKEQKTRLFIFDEMQVLIDRESAKLNYKVAEWLKRLINQARKPIVVVGLDKTEQLFLANEQLRRRFRAPFFMSSLDWHNLKRRKVLKGFLKAIGEKLDLEEGLKLSSGDMVFRFYCATNGLVGYIMDLIREAHDLASECHDPVIQKSHLAKAYVNVVCGNHLVGVNPFTDAEENIGHALVVVEPSLVSKGAKTNK